MSIVASDLVFYGAANIAEDNVSTHGGAIDTTVRYIFDDPNIVKDVTASGGAGGWSIYSSAVGDSGTYAVTGRNAGGSIIAESGTLTGTTPVSATGTFDRILKVTVGSHTGVVTLDDDSANNILNIESGVLTVRRPFYNVSADVAGGSSRDFYEKVFLKNNNSVNSLLACTITEAATGISGLVTFDVEDAVNDNNSVSSRLNTVPSGMNSAFDSNSDTIPGDDLAAGSAIGVWLKLTLAAGAAAQNDVYQLNISGSTT